jgi:hypothetical protein
MNSQVGYPSVNPGYNISPGSTIVQSNEIPVVTHDNQIMTSSDIKNIKQNVENEYTGTNRGSSTLWTVLGVTLLLLLVIAIVVTLFFLFFNPPAMHEITIVNNCSQDIYVMVGAVGPNQTINFLPTQLLTSQESGYYQATPGTSIIVQGFRNNDSHLVNAINPFTTVEITFAGENFSGKHQVTDGNVIISDVYITTNSIDKYGVSVQGGYNIPITLTARNFANNNNSGNFYCSGPQWNHTINATGPDACPDILQSPGTGSNYQVCLNPCTANIAQGFCCEQENACSATGGCQQLWPIKEYYDVFHDACPNCLITNCDDPNYTCNSNNGSLTQYIITLCP